MSKRHKFSNGVTSLVEQLLDVTRYFACRVQPAVLRELDRFAPWSAR